MSKSEIRERERRWAVPAAAAAGVAILLYLVSRFIEGSALPSSGGAAVGVQAFHNHSGTLLLSSVIGAIGFFCLAGPLLYLFRAVEARVPTLRRGFVAFVVLGPLLLGVQMIAGWVISNSFTNDAVTELATEQTTGYAQLLHQADTSADSITHVTVYPDDGTFEVESAGSQFATGDLPKDPNAAVLELTREKGIASQPKVAPKDAQSADQHPESYTDFVTEVFDHPDTVKAVAPGSDSSTLLVESGGQWHSVDVPSTTAAAASGIMSAKSVDVSTDSDGAAGDDLAQSVIDNSSGRTFAIVLTYAGLFSMAAGVFYVSIQAMRAGLLARFGGSLGAGLGAALILAPPLALPGTLLWSGYLALLFVGRWPGGRPPAWDAVEAMPWPKPGEGPPRGGPPPPDEVQGTAEEILGTDPPETNGSGGTAPQRRKRKRRG
jgi:hypothetical protein